MTVILRRPTATDAKSVASLLVELGYPSAEVDARDRLVRSLDSATSCIVVAESDGDVIGTINAELIPYFPNGTTICRVTALVVSSRHRSRGLGEKLIAHVAEFARAHPCSGIEVTR